MINKTFVLTSIFAAIFMTFTLRFMELFSFINWSPVGWANKWTLFSSFHISVKWGLLFLSMVIVFAILYILFSFLDAIFPAISAIILSVIGVIVLEWLISEPKSPIDLVKSISIPLLAVTLIVLRFISGTAVFIRKLSKKV